MVIELPCYAEKEGVVYKVPNTKKLSTSFSPNYIHSMDAWLLMCFKLKNALVNHVILLDTSENYTIQNYSNHDCFSSTSAPLLKYLLEDSYKDLYFQDYLKTLQYNSGYEKIIKYWSENILLDPTIAKLPSRPEAHMGLSTGISLGAVDLGSTTNLNLHPSFVK